MILITGATGKTGGETAKALVARGAKVRALVRDAGKAAGLKALGVELATGDVADAAAVRQALAGCAKLLIILPNSEKQAQYEKQLVDFGKAAGVKHVVKMSSMEAKASATTPIPMAHWGVEEYIRASGVAWTMVKPNFFMQNLLASARTINAQNMFTMPMGNGKTAMSDCRDLGAVTAEVLVGKGHEGKSYEITGPELLTFAQAAERFSKVLGREIRYVPADPAAFREILGKVLVPWHADAVSALFREIAEGGLEYTTDTFRKLMGREPNSLAQFVADHRAVFTPA